MSNSHIYHGLEVTLLIYRSKNVATARARNDDHGFDAAVRIRERLEAVVEPRIRVFKLNSGAPFSSVGDAHRASIK